MIYKAVGINWDCDGEDQRELGLPTEVEIPTEVAENEDYGAVADYLSDEYGFCVNGFNLTETKEVKVKKKNVLYIVVTKTMNDMCGQSQVGGVFTTKKQAVGCYLGIIRKWKEREPSTFEDAIIERYDSEVEGYSFSAYLEGYSCDWSRDVWIETCELNKDYTKEE